MTADHIEQLGQQITRAWGVYVTACLDHQADAAALAMAQINRLLELIPLPRQSSDEETTRGEGVGLAP